MKCHWCGRDLTGLVEGKDYNTNTLRREGMRTYCIWSKTCHAPSQSNLLAREGKTINDV